MLSMDGLRIRLFVDEPIARIVVFGVSTDSLAVAAESVLLVKLLSVPPYDVLFTDVVLTATGSSNAAIVAHLFSFDVSSECPQTVK